MVPEATGNIQGWCGSLPAGSVVLWQQWTNTQGLQKSCGEKGWHGHSKWERRQEGQREPKRAHPLPGQAFIAFLGTLHQGQSSLTYYAQVHCRWLPFTDNKGKNAANYFKEKDVTDQGGKWWNRLHSILGRFSTDFRKLKILSKHLLPQSRVREF